MLRGNCLSPIAETLIKLPDNVAHSRHKNFLSNSSLPTSNSVSLANACNSPNFLEKHHTPASIHSKSLFIPLNSSIDFNFENSKTISSCISPSGLPHSPISMPFNNTSMEVNALGSFVNSSPKSCTTGTSIPKPIATDDKLPASVDKSSNNRSSLVQSNDKNSIRDLSLSPLHPSVKLLFELANCTFTDRSSALSAAIANKSHLVNSQITVSETHSHYLNLGQGNNSYRNKQQNLPSSSSTMTTSTTVVMNNILETNPLKYSKDVNKILYTKAMPTVDKVKHHVENPKDCIAIRNMKRWFYQVDLMLFSADEKLSSCHTENFYLGLISKANDYAQKLNHLKDLPEISSANFDINLYLKRLKEYVSTLDCFLRSKTVKDELDMATAKAYINSISNKLNRYDGNVLYWPIFRATYQNMVLHNSRLSDFIKFRLLFDNLDVTTRMLLKDIDLINSDPQLAFSRLCSHFDNLFDLICVLKRIPFVENTYNIDNWYMLLESTMLAKRFLAGKQSKDDLDYEKECLIILLGKLAPKHTEDYFKILNVKWKLNDFMAYCQRKICGLERMSYLGVDLTTIPVSKSMCPICKKDFHFPERCGFSVEERKVVVRANRLCFRCLEMEYFKGHCCQNKCSHCGGKHHLALCHSFPANNFKSKGTASQRHKLHHPSRWTTELAHTEMAKVCDIQVDHVNYRKITH